MIDLLEYDFMRRALLAAVVTGLAAPAIGTYLVQRRLALLGDGLGHVALTGVALGLLAGFGPILMAVLVTILAALLLELLRARAGTSTDLALAMLFYGGIAGGVLLTNLAGESAAGLSSFLFGSITTVSPFELVVVVVLGLLVVGVSMLLAPQFFALCQDEEHATVSGLRTPVLSALLSVLAAVTITVAMRTVGLLLVSALMVVPVAAAQQLARGFRATHLAAMGIGLFCAVAGVTASYWVETQPGPTIVVIAIAVFAAAAVARVALRALGRRAQILT